MTYDYVCETIVDRSCRFEETFTYTKLTNLPNNCYFMQIGDLICRDDKNKCFDLLNQSQ